MRIPPTFPVHRQKESGFLFFDSCGPDLSRQFASPHKLIGSLFTFHFNGGQSLYAKKRWEISALLVDRVLVDRAPTSLKEFTTNPRRFCTTCRIFAAYMNPLEDRTVRRGWNYWYVGARNMDS